MRVTLKFGKLFGTDIELESYMVQKYGIVSAICLLSNYYLHIIYICRMTPNCAFRET